MTLEILTPSPSRRQLETDLRRSLVISTLTVALAQARAALESQPPPTKLSDLHPHDRQRLQDAAIQIARQLNRDAELFAIRSADNAAFDVLESRIGEGLAFVQAQLPQGMDVEDLVTEMTRAAVKRFTAVLAGLYPGLDRHLASVERCRTTDADPELADDPGSLYEDPDRLISCDACDRVVNIEDSTHGFCSSGESRQCWKCVRTEPLWKQHGLSMPAWEKDGK